MEDAIERSEQSRGGGGGGGGWGLAAVVVRKGWAGSGRRSLLLISLPGQPGLAQPIPLRCPPVPAFITPPRCACPRLLPAPLQPRALVSHSSPVATHHGEPCSALALPCSAHAHAPARAAEGGRDSVTSRLRVGGDRRREWRRGREIRTRRRTEGRGGGEWGTGFGSERERGEEG
ncbi:hypothetical protein KC19_3G165600 [Ceratodon purpureus]|uniref:Uncharacterized protein n=1 Tax=Ceratodon purpureus TaxID=3225 RepID=A0A8T0ILS9_CERPU|nr:hypothetical protein KC19_3G165600 [Ceratodon purpureus]